MGEYEEHGKYGKYQKYQKYFVSSDGVFWGYCIDDSVDK
jgi:hypothetical protein